jgi:hypothetical protein
MKRFTHILIITVLLISSCIKEIEIKTETVEKLPVINCIFSPDSVFKVSVSLPIEITSNTAQYVEDAVIKITSEDNTVINLFYTGSNGIYKSAQKPLSNVLYTLEADINGYETVRASDMIPVPVYIENVEYYHDQDVLNNDSIPMSNISFVDDGNIENYYDCIGFALNQETGMKEYFNSPYYGEFYPDNVLLNEGDIDYYPSSFFFSDVLFNGSEYTLSVPIAGGPFYNSNIEFRVTSRNYYLFRKYWTRHYYNQSNDHNVGTGFIDVDFMGILRMSDPIEMFSNIENGYGIFAGYSADIWLSDFNN